MFISVPEFAALLGYTRQQALRIVKAKCPGSMWGSVSAKSRKRPAHPRVRVNKLWAEKYAGKNRSNNV